MNISNCSLKDECQFVKELKNKISNMKESYETDAEAKFYDYVDKYNSKKLLMANDYVELNKNNKTLILYNQALLKENQELKKQLEETDRKLFLTKNELDMRQKTIDNKLNQQQEFINWLEAEIKSYEAISDLLFNHNKELKVYKEVLAKCKETIGGNKDE